MRKHLYFHSSNLDYTIDLSLDESFEPTHLYPKKEYNAVHRNEYGRIKTTNTYCHFLIGSIPNHDCPWCGCSDVQVKKEEDKSYETMNPFAKDKYWIQCCRCGSRGPVVFVDQIVSTDGELKDYILSMIKERYSQRLAWDSKLENCAQCGGEF